MQNLSEEPLPSAGPKVPTAAFHFRCSDAEFERLTRRQDGRDGAKGERPGIRLNRALVALCEEVEHGEEFAIGLSDGEPPRTAQRKARIPQETVDRVDAIVARLPGVSRDMFTREAIRRATRAY